MKATVMLLSLILTIVLYGCGNNSGSGISGHDRYRKGTITFANGDHYRGELKNGVAHGYGIYTWTNGNKYIGHFRDGKADGMGSLYLPDGLVLRSGKWRNGKYIGR